VRTFELTTSVWLPAEIDRVFEFFSRADNLERLTPPFLNFRIVTPPPVAMRRGTLIDYRIALHGLPLRWRSEITLWDPPHRFVDEQRRGPYRRWRHTHAFEARGEGTLVADRVEYALWGGALVNRLLVAPDLRRIFRYRHTALRELFGGAEAPTDVRVVEAR
jgi:ligand-binding SRPBCC domain-containing protein